MTGDNQRYKMKFSLATNFDPKLVEEVKKYDKGKSITSMFGKLRSDIVGGGRSSVVLPDLSMRELKEYVDLCHANGLKFNYLLNPMCMGNREIQAPNHRKILKYIGRLADIGIDAITINSPYLCELIKKRYPHFTITIGLYAYIFNIQHLKYWEELGADELTLHHIVNRNFPLLEEFLKYSSKSGLKLRLIANNVCLHDCPYQINHGTGQAHASQKGSFSNHLYLDYNILSCNYKRIKSPTKLISSEWIRPEDIKHYEDLCTKTQNYDFSIKLLERTKTTEFLVEVIKAYMSRSYAGNLINILTLPTAKNTKVIHTLPIYIGALLGRYNISDLRTFVDIFNLPEIYIDNKKLDGFLDKFMLKYDCSRKLCDDSGWLDSEDESDQQTCSYCKRWAKKAISFDKEELERWGKDADGVFASLLDSRIFNV